MMTLCLKWQLSICIFKARNKDVVVVVVVAIENLYLSQLELSTCDDVSFGSCEVPSVTCNALDKLSVYD